MEKLETWQILWGINTFLLGIIVVIFKGIWDDIKEMKKEIQARTLIINCNKTHEELKEDLHVHGTFGSAGEVIKK